MPNALCQHLVISQTFLFLLHNDQVVLQNNPVNYVPEEMLSNKTRPLKVTARERPSQLTIQAPRVGKVPILCPEISKSVHLRTPGITVTKRSVIPGLHSKGPTLPVNSF